MRQSRFVRCDALPALAASPIALHIVGSTSFFLEKQCIFVCGKRVLELSAFFEAWGFHI